MKKKITFGRKAVFQAVLTGLLILGMICFEKTREVAQAAGVTLTAAPAVQVVRLGQSAVYTININRDGFPDKVTLSATGLPAGVTADFNANPTTAGSSALTLKTTSAAPTGIFNITVKAAAAGVAIAPMTVKLETKPAPVSISVLPAAQNIVAGQSAAFEIALQRFDYGGLVALSARDLPEGVTVKFTPEKTDGNSARMVLYSNGLPSFPADFYARLVAVPVDHPPFESMTLIRVRVNCNVVWVEQFAAPDNQTQNPDFATAVVSDNPPNSSYIYTVGDTFVPGTNGNPGDFDAWVAKYDAGTGYQRWLKTVTLNQPRREDRATDVAVDINGNVYVAGYRQNSSNSVNYDIFIAKFDPNGNQTASNFFGGAFEDGSSGLEITFDANGANPILTAVTTIRRGNEQGDNRTFTSASYNIERFILDSNLRQTNLGSSVMVSNLRGNPEDLTIDTNGLIYTVGEIADLGLNNYQAFITKGNGNTTLQTHFFSFSGTTDEDDYPAQVKIDGAGNPLVTGTSIGGLPQGVPLHSWIIKLDDRNFNNVEWRRSDFTRINPFGQFPQPVLLNLVNALAIDGSGDVFSVGSTAVNFEQAANGFFRLTPNGDSNAFVMKHSGTDGRILFQRVFNVADKDYFQALALDNSDSLLLAGTTVLFKTALGFEDALLMNFSMRTSYLAPLISGLSTNSVRRNTQFSIYGQFFEADSVEFAGNFLGFTIVSPTEIRATAPNVASTTTGNVRVLGGCFEAVSPGQLTVTP